jgi:predicted negative regulator of RcsB-dependent stress response
MKTTVDLPDEMLHLAKMVAAQRKTTLKELIMQGLAHVTRSTSHDEQQKRQDALRRLVAGLKATNFQPMVPLTRGEIHDR